MISSLGIASAIDDGYVASFAGFHWWQKNNYSSPAGRRFEKKSNRFAWMTLRMTVT